MNINQVIEKLRGVKIVPVVKLERLEDALPLADALLQRGIDVIEVTFRTAVAADAIAAIKAAYPSVTVGAGTVLTIENCQKAIDAGADFIVAPGLNDLVVGYCLDKNMPMIPGVATPSEIELALNYGLTHLKFFPAEENGGVAKLKALAAPYSMISFMPTGGITPTNAPTYLALPNVFCCGASYLSKLENLK